MLVNAYNLKNIKSWCTVLSTANLSWFASLSICQFRSHLLMFIYSLNIYAHALCLKNGDTFHRAKMMFRWKVREVGHDALAAKWKPEIKQTTGRHRHWKRWEKWEWGRERVLYADAPIKHHLAGLLASCCHLPKRENWLKWKEFAKNADAQVRWTQDNAMGWVVLFQHSTVYYYKT